MAWEDVKNEMVNEKGLSEEVADQIGQFVSMQGEQASVKPAVWCIRICWSWISLTNDVFWPLGGKDLAERLLQDPRLSKNKQACAGLTDMKQLFSYLELFQVTDKVRFGMFHKQPIRKQHYYYTVTKENRCSLTFCIYFICLYVLSWSSYPCLYACLISCCV